MKPVFPRKKNPRNPHKQPIYINYHILCPYFRLPLHAAANALGMCPTTMKKVCRGLGIERWPRKGILAYPCFHNEDDDWTKGHEPLWEAALLDRPAAFENDASYYWHPYDY